MFRKISSITASLLFGLLFFSSPTFAKEAAKPAIWLQISPVSNRVMLAPGRTLEYNFSVENIGSEEFSYKIYPAAYSVNNEEYDINFAKQTKRTQLSRWIKFRQADGTWVNQLNLKLTPGKKEIIKYQVNVPKDIPSGGQYATIFAESEPSDKNTKMSGIKTISRVGLVVFGNTSGDTRQKAEITDYKFTSFLTKGQISSHSRIKNSGNTDFAAHYKFNIQSLFGKEIYNKELSYDVLPSTTRRVSLKWDDTPGFGIYKVTYKVSALDQSRSETKIVLIMPVFIIVIMLVLLTLSIIWIIILFRKRRQRKSKLIV